MEETFPLTDDPDLLEELVMELYQDVQDLSFDLGRAAMVLSMNSNETTEVIYQRAEKDFNDASERLRFVLLDLLGK